MKVFDKNNSKTYEIYNQDSSQSKAYMKILDESLIMQSLLLDQNSLLVITLVDILQNMIDGIQLIFASSNADFLDNMNQYLYSADTCNRSEQYKIDDFVLKSTPLIICTLLIDILIFISIIYFKRKIRNQPFEMQKANKSIYSNQQYNYDSKGQHIHNINVNNCLQIGIIQIRILLRTEILLSTAREYIQICDFITLLLAIFWIVERQNQWQTKMIVLDLNLVYLITRFQLKLNLFTLLKSIFLIIILLFQYKYRVLLEHKLEHFISSMNKMFDKQEMHISKNTQYNTASFQTKLEQQQIISPSLSKKQSENIFKYQNSINDIEKKFESNMSFHQQLHFQKQNTNFSQNKSPRVFNRLAQNNKRDSFSSKISPILAVMDMIPSTIMQANMRKQSVFRKVITSDHLLDRPDQNCKMSSLSLQVLNQINQGVLLMNLNQCIVFHNQKILDIFGISQSSKILQRLFQLKKECKVKEGNLLDNKQSKAQNGFKDMSSSNPKPHSKTSQCIQNSKNQTNHYEFGGKKSQQSNSIINSQPSIHEIQGVSRIRSKRGEQNKQTFLNNKSQSSCDFFLVPPKVLFNNNTNGNNNKKKSQINVDEDEEQMNDEKSIREVEEDQTSDYYQSSYVGSQKNEKNIKKKKQKSIDQLRQSLQVKNKQNADNLKQQKDEFLYSTDEKSFEVIISEIISLIQLYRQNMQHRQCKSENNLDKNLLVQDEWLQNCERTIQRLQDEGYKFNAVLDNEQFQQIMNQQQQNNSFSQNHIASANNNSFQDETNSNSKNMPSTNQTSIQQINIQIQNSQKIVQDAKQNSPRTNNINNEDTKQGNKIISVQIKLWNSPSEDQNEGENTIKKQSDSSSKADTKKSRKISNIFAEKLQVPMLFIIFEDITQQVEQEEQDRMNRFKLKILSSISHELRTPLNSSMLLLQILIQSENLSQSIKQDYLEPAFYNNQLLYFMINDIMDYAQISQNSFQLKFSTFELRSTLQDCLNLFSYSFEDKGINLSLIIERSINIINSDSERIKQVLINLLSNALKYTTSGSVVVSAIPSLTQKDIIEISVEDTGCGIPPHLHKDIFEYMDNPNQKKQDLNSNGAGLGLTISQKIVRGLSGNRGISLESEEGQGSKFTFYVKNKEPQLSKQAHGKKNNQFNNIFLNWKSMSYTTMQSQEFKSDLSSMKGQSNKSQLTPQHGSSPISRGSMNFQGSKEENDRKMLLNMYVKRNSYVRKGSKFLEENLLLKDNTALSSSLDQQYDMYHMNQIGERRNSKRNQNQLFVHYDKPSFIGIIEQDIDSRRNYTDSKNPQMRSCDVIESFTELDNYKNQVPALQPFQGHSSIVHAENNTNKRLFNQSQNIPSSPIRNGPHNNNNKISQVIEQSRRKSQLQIANNNITSHDNIIQLNKNLRILAAQEYNQSPNITLKTVKEINDESVDLDSTNNPINTDKNPNSTRRLMSKYKQQESNSPINSDDHCQSFTDLDSTKNIDGKDHTFMFQGQQQTSTVYQDTPFMQSNREQNMNQMDSYEKLKLNNQNFDLNNMSFNTTAINIESERTPVINLKQVNDQLDLINEQLSPEIRNHFKNNQDNSLFGKSEQTEIKINNQQEEIQKNIVINNNDLDNTDMEKLTQQYSNEQLQIKQNQLKKNLQEYFEKKQCKCNQVLVVDDIQFNVSVMKKLLASYGVNIDQAVNGKNAFDVVVQKMSPQSNSCCKHYKLILMDLEMPVMNGFESAQAILEYYQKNQKNINPPIISACSAYQSSEDKMQAKKRGMKFFIGKPIQMFHLDLVLEYCLLKKRR